MQIKHKVLRAAAAAAVAAFMTMGAVAPVHADDADEQAGSSTGTQTAQERAADQADRGDEGRVDAEEDSSSEDDGDEAGDETAGPDDADDDAAADETEAGEETSGPGTTCDQLGYTKLDRSNGSEELEFGTLDWAGDTLSYVIDEGYTVDLCIKSGVKAPITEFTVTGAVEGSEQIAQDISHIGYVMTEGAAEEAQPEETQEEAQEEATVAPEEDGTCPDGSTMNDEGECVVPATEIDGSAAETSDQSSAEVLGVEAERAAADTAVADEAALAPASGILPATGAGDYALAILAGVGLLGAGGVLLARRRAQVDG